MVSKKTQTSEAKKADAKSDEKVKVVAEKKKPATKSVAKKTVAKKTATKKVNEPKVVEAPVLEKENIDNLAKVLAVKAENENKKAVKAAKKEVKVAKKEAKDPAKKTTVRAKEVEIKNEVMTEPVEEPGKKATPARSKREVVKENVQKAQSKKFVEQKNEAVKCACCCKCKEFFAAWGRAYKNMFKYKARTSRYENWAFMLFNCIFSSILFFCTLFFVTPALNEGNSSPMMAFGVIVFVLLFFIIQMFVYIALTVRRLHDAGFSAWKGFFRPLTYSAVAVAVLTPLAGKYMDLSGNLTAENYLSTHITNLVLSVSLLVAILTWSYYSFKTIIVSFFFEENKTDTTYGVAMYHDECYKAKALRYMVWYLIYSSISYSLLNMYIAMITNTLGA